MLVRLTNHFAPVNGCVDSLLICSLNQPSPRKELLHNIDPLYPPIGKKLYPDTFDNRFRAAIRVGDMKLLTGSVGKIKMQPKHVHLVL